MDTVLSEDIECIIGSFGTSLELRQGDGFSCLLVLYNIVLGGVMKRVGFSMLRPIHLLRGRRGHSRENVSGSCLTVYQAET